MSNSTHTPGPWKSEKTHDGRSAGYVRCSRKVGTAPLGIAICRVNSTALPLSEVEANERLIESSPELLEELKRCRELLCKLSVQYQGAITQDDQDQIANTNRLALSLINRVGGYITC